MICSSSNGHHHYILIWIRLDQGRFSRVLRRGKRVLITKIVTFRSQGPSGSPDPSGPVDNGLNTWFI